MWKFLCIGLILFASLGVQSAVFDESDDVFDNSSSNTNTRTKSRQRAYPGGRDEQDLKVQSQLSIPPRSPDGTVVETSSSGAAPD